MKRLLLTTILIGVIYILGTLVFTEIRTFVDDASLTMSGVNLTSARTAILKNYNESILPENELLSDDAAFKINPVYINTDKRIDLVASVNSEATCGTGGCIVTLYIQNDEREYIPLNFAYTVKELSVKNSITNEMHDLEINNDDSMILKWNGEEYSLNVQ
ncbi:MAG: hypothetical protein K9M10_01335 [Candidatus Pacebacteria bacterium]|nr:hypothetical protein [Candidatus Paceibacterota bacterium]MCF7857106.1 hypothetical protein [Candidatus Paceibacterota bacterium]